MINTHVFVRLRFCLHSLVWSPWGFILIWFGLLPGAPIGYFGDFGGAAIDLNSCLKQKLGKRLGKGRKWDAKWDASGPPRSDKMASLATVWWSRLPNLLYGFKNIIDCMWVLEITLGSGAWMCLKHDKYECFCQFPVLLAFISLEPVRLHFSMIWAAPWSPNWICWRFWRGGDRPKQLFKTEAW